MVCEQNIVVRLEEGLHARPAATLARRAKAFAASIDIAKGSTRANAKSSVQIMLLAVKEGESVLVCAEGDDADKAVGELTSFLSGEQGWQAMPPSMSVPLPVATVKSPCLRGVPASPGVALGPAFVHFPERPDTPDTTVPPDAVDAEIRRFADAAAAVAASLDATIARLAGDAAGHSEGEVLLALRDVTMDVDIAEQVHATIRTGQNAVHAVLSAGEHIAAKFAKLDDPYLRARAEDVRAVVRRIADTLLGVVETALDQIAEPCILVADDLSALDLSRLPAGRLLGLVTVGGCATSHVAIIARSLGVPAVVSVAAEPAVLRAARRVAIDGSDGVVFLNPDPATERDFTSRIEQLAGERRRLAEYIAVEPRTRSGQLIEVAANIGGPQDVAAALAHGAQGVGLFRTEFLFMRGRFLPDELTQAAMYADVLKACAPHPVVIRTADIGGDKSLPLLGIEREDNPFLGWRGIRLCLGRLDIFRPQLRALLRASVAGRLRIMFPMVADESEVHAARALLAAAADELIGEGVDIGNVEVGIMIETPAAALCAETLAKSVDFFSIGTNDLTQYIMAADRTNSRLAHLQQANHPAVLRSIEMTCQAARAAGIWVGVCGEAAGDPALIPTLVRLGVTELSMSPPLIPRAKKLVTELC